METLLSLDGHPANVNHQKGCNNVVNMMCDKYGERFALGIIDNDKRKPTYLKVFNEVGKSEHLILLKHKSRCHYIILVSKAVEDLILSCATEEEMFEQELPYELEAFKKETKNVNSKNDIRFKYLFKAIKEAREMKIFRDVLSYLLANRYNCDTDELSALFSLER
ncbi:MAG: hypothetical protein LUC86_03650 [Prevotellaceae bacterium]|nr:hypothetical protein [Prevotellaceae bacterium]